MIPPTCLDGGLATQLEAHGYKLADRLWSARLLLDAPEAIEAVHAEFVAAGAEIITTATYQATLPGFLECGLTPQQARHAVERAVHIARGSGAKQVAGSVGPYGAYLADGSEYRGDDTLDQVALRAFHRPRLIWLAEAGVDWIACETIPSLREAEALVREVESLGLTRCWLSVSLKTPTQVSAGDPLEQIGRLVENAPAIAAAGINCVRPSWVRPALEALRRGTRKPLVAYPNSGELWNPQARHWTAPATKPIAWPDQVKRWLACGARIIGGCCRTTPTDIAAIARTITSHPWPAEPPESS